MVKFLFRIIVSLCILISSGYSLAYAGQDTDSAFAYTDDSYFGFNNTSGHPLTFSAESQDHGKDIFVVNNSKNEEDDDDYVALKDFLDSSSYYSTLFFTKFFGFLFLDLPKGSHFSEHLSIISPHTWRVLIQVFII